MTRNEGKTQKTDNKTAAAAQHMQNLNTKSQSESQPLSRVRLFVTPQAVAHQAPLSMEFSRQEFWSWLPFPYPGDPPNPGIKPRSPPLRADSLLTESPGKP